MDLRNRNSKKDRRLGRLSDNQVSDRKFIEIERVYAACELKVRTFEREKAWPFIV